MPILTIYMSAVEQSFRNKIEPYYINRQVAIEF